MELVLGTSYEWLNVTVLAVLQSAKQWEALRNYKSIIITNLNS